MEPTTLAFKTADTSLAHRNGSAIRILQTITEPDATHDAEVLPMHVVEFPDGVKAEIWPDEAVAA
ncbi:hypothetical protein LJ753_16685 [Arthrobacter sp. zg-Y20]|uniref:hypothetical protein n=1 Tax=unclassified Arthrobacter TaxID=235627 RepID=UPI001D13A400|nr:MULTISPECIES: hypothetical protein [unclassified Arthrobacter]MCC3277502.1 hypothetical protein [Arthrobacter sp. zg-Y20]MDK1317662.1 hypothetical protein [Arthrobacter sp. zg.Y20]WIB07078.1 hypothetical protein QNO06_04940 [Arthrobacter sp. zg-Y20]